MSTAAHAQTLCLPASSDSEVLITYLKRLVTTTDPYEQSARDNYYKVPVVSSASITLVTDVRTCEKASAAYGPAPEGPPNPKVYVVKLGSDGYAVLDPLQTGEGGAQTVMIFDRKWIAIGGWTGP